VRKKIFSSAPGRRLRGAVEDVGYTILGFQPWLWGPLKRSGRFDCEMLRIWGAGTGGGRTIRGEGVLDLIVAVGSGGGGRAE